MTYQEAKRTATVPPEEISRELIPIVEELGLVENCRQLARRAIRSSKTSRIPVSLLDFATPSWSRRPSMTLAPEAA